MVRDEPVRGVCPDPSLFSLPGIERLRAYMRHQMPDTPLFRLLGCLVTQASTGNTVLMQPISPWFDVNHGFIELTPTAEYSLYTTALTGAPPGVLVRPINLTVRYLRPCTVDDENVVARGRILHSGSSFTTVDILIEDAMGRAVLHASGSAVFAPVDPPPPPLSGPLSVVSQPTYATPDPPRKPLTAEVAANLPAGEDPAVLPPMGEFLGIELADHSPGRARVTMASSPWFMRIEPVISPGIIGAGSNVAVSAAVASARDPDERMVVMVHSMNFLRAVPADGRLLAADGNVRHRTADVGVVESTVTDADGHTVAMSQGLVMLRPVVAPRRRQSDRVLLTVVLTDLVDSTVRARELGDRRWNELLEDHHALIRRRLEQFRGREVKTTGDGFLCTFDSPTRAVQFARAIREGVHRLGLELRIGIHTGECEVTGGDVAGLAVHVAARLESLAAAGEIQVSSTVRDLVEGSGFTLYERGTHELKGLVGSWTLFAVE